MIVSLLIFQRLYHSISIVGTSMSATFRQTATENQLQLSFLTLILYTLLLLCISASASSIPASSLVVAV